MAIAKLILNNATQMDLTADTVTTSDHIMEGYVGHLRNGTSVTGTGKIAASEQASLDALVRYSNEVTGESDTTISEMDTLSKTRNLRHSMSHLSSLRQKGVTIPQKSRNLFSQIK